MLLHRLDSEHCGSELKVATDPLDAIQLGYALRYKIDDLG
jgi:hypothetical protein